MNEDQITIYQTEDGQTQIDVRLENETVWLTQALMALLFEKTPQNITMHIRNAYNEGELDRKPTYKEYLQVQWFCALWQRKRRFVQKQYRTNLPNFWRRRALSERRGEGCHAALSGNKEPFIQRWQQAYCPTLFLWFLNNNDILYRSAGSKRLADNTLVALTLMIAESRTEEKDVMVKVIVNLINQQNE